MPSSELSDALNPNVVRQRNYDEVLLYQDQQAYPNLQHLNFPVDQQQYQYHRSELELAVVEPSPVQRPRPASINPTQELLRVLTSLREFEQVEKVRRLAWEKEQQAVLAQIREQNEQKLRSMQEEIDSLKEYIRHFEPTTTTVPTASRNSVPEPPREPTPFQDLPQEHLDSPYPLFVQGSSTDPASQQGNGAVVAVASTDDNLTPYTRKRTSSPSSNSDKSSECDELSNPPRPAKRINGHDTRCLTIQHAMRSHLNRLMAISDEDPLPTNYIEGAPLADDEPIRFIWARTIKQSQHNTQMKKRVISDLVENKELYKHVPRDDFKTDTLDIVFDQTFSTLRSRYKAQTDANIAQKRKEKEIKKMIKTRRANRKRAKLELRTACRKKNETYSHPTFDGAFQLECMSSEESEDGSVSRDVPQPRLSGRTPKSAVIRVQGLGWRSSRMVKLFHILDEAGQNDPTLSSTLPRGDKGKQKMTGETKDMNRAGTFVLPPKGVSFWMISRRWLGRANLVHRDLSVVLRGLIVERPGFDWRLGAAILGHESETEEESRYRMQQYNSSSSLQYALAHP